MCRNARHGTNRTQTDFASEKTARWDRFVLLVSAQDPANVLRCHPEQLGDVRGSATFGNVGSSTPAFLYRVFGHSGLRGLDRPRGRSRCTLPLLRGFRTAVAVRSGSSLSLPCSDTLGCRRCRRSRRPRRARGRRRWRRRSEAGKFLADSSGAVRRTALEQSLVFPYRKIVWPLKLRSRLQRGAELFQAFACGLERRERSVQSHGAVGFYADVKPVCTSLDMNVRAHGRRSVTTLSPRSPVRSSARYFCQLSKVRRFSAM